MDSEGPGFHEVTEQIFEKGPFIQGIDHTQWQGLHSSGFLVDLNTCTDFRTNPLCLDPQRYWEYGPYSATPVPFLKTDNSCWEYWECESGYDACRYTLYVDKTMDLWERNWVYPSNAQSSAYWMLETNPRHFHALVEDEDCSSLNVN